MGQNSSVQNCDREKIKRVETSGSEITILRTIVQRRGSTTKIKRHIHQRKDNKDFVIDVKNKTKHDGESETIAELIRNSKKQNTLSQQEKFLERVMESKNSMINDKYSRYPSTPANTTDESLCKQSKSIKNWTIKDPNKSYNPSTFSIHTVYTKKQKKVENNGDTNYKILVKKNNREKINELFQTLQTTVEKEKERNRNFCSKKKLKSLSISSQKVVTIPPANETYKQKHSKLYEKQIDESKYRIDQLTKQHLQHQKFMSENTNLQNENHHDSGFENLLSELKCKISPSQQNGRTSSTTCTIKENESINSFNFSSRSFRTSNDTFCIKDTSEIQDRFKSYSVTESIEPKIDKKYINNENTNQFQIDSDTQNIDYFVDNRNINPLKQKIRYYKVINSPSNDVGGDTPLGGKQNILNQKRYRSVNDNSKIYYYKKTNDSKKATGFVEYPLPDIPLESQKSDIHLSDIDKNDSNRKCTWVQDKDNNWHKVIL